MGAKTPAWLKALADDFTKPTITQTYSDTDTTVAAPTAVAPTVNEPLAGVDTGVDMTAAQAAGLVSDIFSLETQVNALIADNLNLRKVLGALIDLFQDAGMAD